MAGTNDWHCLKFQRAAPISVDESALTEREHPEPDGEQCPNGNHDHKQLSNHQIANVWVHVQKGMTSDQLLRLYRQRLPEYSASGTSPAKNPFRSSGLSQTSAALSFGTSQPTN